MTKNAWKNRIVGYGEADPTPLSANEYNWRTHPQEQQDALEESLAIGWIQDIIVNKRSAPAWGDRRGIETVLDGHARIELAIRHGETIVPVKYVDLGPVEELQMLASLDRITGMAGQDDKMLLEIVKHIQEQGAGVPAMQQWEIDSITKKIEGKNIADPFGGDVFTGALPDLDYPTPESSLRIIITFETKEQMENALQFLGVEEIDYKKVSYKYDELFSDDQE